MLRWADCRERQSYKPRQTGENVKNIETVIDGNKLVITVDLSKSFGPSKSGKTIIIASSEGNKPIKDGDGAVLGLNVYRPTK